jgi:hypothetical protein
MGESLKAGEMSSGPGDWKRAHGYSYAGTQGETPDTAKEPP